MVIASKEKYNSIGYMEDGKQIICCDSKAFESKRCANPNKFILNQEPSKDLSYKRVVFTYF